MDLMDFEWVERPCSRNSEHMNTHEDDMDSLGVISLEDSASEGCGTPSAAAAAVITALEDAGPFDELQDIINEAMASIHCVSPSTAAVQQEQEQEPEQQAVESEAIFDSSVGASPSTSAAYASSSAASAAAAHAAPADSSEHTPSSTDNPNTSDKATPRSTSTRPAQLLLLVACVATAIATLLLLLLVRPAAFNSTMPTTPSTANAAVPVPVLSQYGRYTATHIPAAMPVNYTRTAAAPAAHATSNEAATKAAAAAAAGGPQGLLQPVSAPINMMLSCPREWQCKYAKPQLAPWLPGATKTNTASRVPARRAGAARACQAAAAAAAAHCPGKVANISAAHKLCTYLWSYHASKPDPTAAAAAAAADMAPAPAKPAVQCHVTQQLQLQQQLVPVGQPQPVSNITNRSSSSSSATGKLSSQLPWLQAAVGLLAAAADQAVKAASAAVNNSTQWWANMTIHPGPSPLAMTAPTPVWRIARPARPVPALYLPAPPCLALANGVNPKPGTSHAKQRVPRSGVQTRSGCTASLFRTTAAVIIISSSSSKALDFAAIKKLVYKAASLGGGLTLPMLPPSAYPQPGSSSNSSSSSSKPSRTESEPAMLPKHVLTLPMLPPVKGHKAVTGGLTLPMLPPVTCATCGSSLQLLPTSSSSRIGAAITAGPTLSPVDQQPTCPMSFPRICTAKQQQYKQQYNLKLQYSQQYMLPRQQPSDKQRGTSAASCKSSSGGVLLVHMPPALTAASSSSSSSSAANIIKMQLGLTHDSTSAPQEVALFARAAAAPTAGTMNYTQVPKTYAAASHEAAAHAITNSSSSSSSASAGAFASGSWAATWVSFPMLLPVEHAAAIHPASNQQQQQQQPASVALNSPWVAMSTYKAHPRKPHAAVGSSENARRGPAALKKGVSFARAAAPAPYRPVRSFKARPAVQPGHRSPSTDASLAAAAAAASCLRSWSAHVNTNAAALLQPAQTVMQIVSTARSRSLQCTIPAADGTSGDGAFDPAGIPSNGTSGSSFGSSAFAANSAALAASKQLFAAAVALDKASWHAADTAGALACAAAEQQQKLQSLCAAVGYARRELQAKLATAVFKQQDAAQTNSAAALFSSATATTATRYPATVYSKSMAASGAGKAATVKAAARFAIPLGPVGGVELRSTVKCRSYTPAAAPHASFKPLAAPTPLQGPFLQGPFLPLQQQLAAHTHAAESSTVQRPADAAARATGVANPHADTGSRSGSSGSGNVWMLNLGWDQRSAWAAAKAAAQLGKAGASLQAACQHLLGPAAAAAA